jgi:hypothetical protein
MDNQQPSDNKQISNPNSIQPKSHGTKAIKELAIVIIFALIIGGAFSLLHHSSKSTATQIVASGCIAKQFSVGSSGNCVSDVQNMVNFMETDNYNQCPFSGMAKLTISGVYDAATQTQVKVVQSWENCYNKQEDSTTRIVASGNVGTSTWSELCTYAYQYPKQSNSSTSPYFKASIAAGKDAGC